MVQRNHVPAFRVRTAQRAYDAVVERGVLNHIASFIPDTTRNVFVVTTRDVWDLFGMRFEASTQRRLHVLFFPGGEVNKRLCSVEVLAEEMLASGADRSSLVIGFGGGIVTDVAGFLAAMFMRGVPVLQIPTTLLAQVDAAVGGKTGVNLQNGKNLIGSFHQPIGVLIDPEVLTTLSDREYRAGLFEVIKSGVIRDPALFALLESESDKVLARCPATVDALITASVRIKAEVVSSDERESDLRRILNFGHTIGHAIEAETNYVEFLHGEAIAWGMLAATELAHLCGLLSAVEQERIRNTIRRYGPLPPASHLRPDRLLSLLSNDKKTLHGKIHFVLPTCIGEVKIISGIDSELIRQAIVSALQEPV
jgi:3-dehydroquinate synthase